MVNSHAVKKTLILSDGETGEILRETTWTGSENGKDWLIMYRTTAALLASGKLSSVAVRTFLFLTAYQDWQGTYKTTKTEMAETMHITRKSLYQALDELKAWGLVKEGKANGQTFFAICPDAVTQGRDKKRRLMIYEAIGENTAERLAAEDALPF